MKIVFPAVAASIIVHVIYIVCTIVYAYIKTKNYKPNVMSGEGKVYFLQSEVAFGVHSSPSSIVFSIVAVAFVCGAFLVLYRKIANLRA